MTTTIFEGLEQRRRDVERTQENSARVAEAFGRFKSTGQGTIVFEERIDFGLTFVEQPFMAYGCEIDLDDLDELMDNTPGPTAPPLPVCTGYVTDWDQDDRGFYTGAWVGTRVWFPYEGNVDPTLNVEIYHHYSFKAVALKDVPTDVRD